MTTNEESARARARWRIACRVTVLLLVGMLAIVLHDCGYFEVAR